MGTSLPGTPTHHWHGVWKRRHSLSAHAVGLWLPHGAGRCYWLSHGASLNLCIMQRLLGDSWHLWLPQWTRQCVLLQAPSWLCWGKTGEICLPSAGCIGWQHSAGGGGSSMTLGLKMIIFCTWKLGIGMSEAIIWIPDIPIWGLPLPGAFWVTYK